MTEHPLTDKMCLELSGFPLDEMAEDWAEWQREDMRAAADWQLEQVIKWIEDEGFNVSSVSYEHLKYDDDHGFQEYVSDFTANLREAMRPQKEQLQQEGNS